MWYNHAMTTIYLTGGAKNGKSALGQELACRLAAPGELYYVATMIPHDGEDRARVARHRRERAGLGFITLEQGSELAALARPQGFYLVDSVTALLTNLMFPPAGFDAEAPVKAAADLREFLRRAGGAVLISDSIGADGGSYDPYTRSFMAGLAYLDRSLAACCDVVAELVAGIPIVYKGCLP
ncbi:MAG: bifunctional adenosylcobinamide kinase/adenosylcobinamide-phosphate guanylyltransferase [Firmicutes bacterium]|nr:bifunctional adenosylcobinamide kinase/adenosylcobinamide-phosphate guanylyltransferase [Bacillota bacterium]